MTVSAMFDPIRIGSLALPNRIVMAPMSRYVSPQGIPTAEFADYHARRAAAGVGLIMTGATGIERRAANNDPNLAHFHGDALPAWQRVVQEVHQAGGRIALQLWHAGAVWNRDASYDPGAPIEAPRASGPEAPASVRRCQRRISPTP